MNMSKKHAAPEAIVDEPVITADALLPEEQALVDAAVVVELPEIPARFFNGGATAEEREAWIAEHRPDLNTPPDDTSTSDVESEGGEA
jgi:hypothetical protein